ncbi:MAG: hypothetical protein U0N82_04805 [Oscillospiraceae bacterium]
MKKRMLTMLLALMLIVSVIPFAASAATKPCKTHDYDTSSPVEIVKAATCTERGIVRYKCKKCDETKKFNVDALGHLPVDVPETPATCTTSKKTAGVKCSRPGCAKPNLSGCELVPNTYLNHDYDNGKITTAAKCGVAGVKTFTCKREGCDATKTESVSALQHTWSNDAKYLVNTLDAATCTDIGRGEFRCTQKGCTETGYLNIPALGHTEEVIPEVPANCTTAKIKAGTKCSTCKKVLVEPAFEYGTSLGHDIVDGKCQRCEIDCPHEHKTWKISASATCVTDGVTGGYVCDDCDEILSGREVIDALGHTYYSATPNKCKVCGFECNHENTLEETEEGRPANCYNAEYFPAVKCTVCNYTKDGYHYGVGLGHTWENGVCAVCKAECVHDYEDISKATAATCEVGYTTAAQQCKVCKYVKEAEVITKPLGHDYNMGYVTTDATCLEDGVKTFTCKREGCGHKRTEPVAARGHHVYSTASADLMDTCIYCLHVCDHKDTLVETEKGIPANCYDAEYFPAVKCTECNYTKAGYRYGTGLGHDLKLGDFISTKPTCLDKGWGRYECQREGCEYTEGGWVPATGHHYEVVQEWNATCTVKGCKKSICEGCNLVRYEDTAPLGHDMKNAPGKEASCTEDGYTAHKKCALCDLTEGKEAIAAGHEIEDYQCKKCGLYLCDHDGEIEIVESTCTVHGTETFSCATCGYEHTKELPLAAHTVEVETTAATCTEAGVTRETCSVCDKELTEIVIPATGHNFVGGACTNNGCDAKVSTDAPSTGGSTSDDTATDDSENSGDNNTPDNSENSGSSSTVTPACGHTHQNTVKQDNSCTTSGSVVTYCTDCNTVVTSQVIDPSGHKYSLGICQVCNAQDPAVYTNDFNNYYIVGGSTK